LSIQKKNGKYVPIIYLGKDPLTNKKIYKWGSYHDKKKDAEKEHAHMILDKENQKNFNIFKDITLGQLAEKHFELIAPKKYANSTIDGYIGYYKKHIYPIFDSRPIKNIETIHVQKFLLTKTELSPATQRKIYYLLKIILDSGVKWNMIKINPCKGVELPEVKRNKNRTVWTPEQVNSFLSNKQVMSSKYYIMLTLSFTLGLRPGEVCGLTWDDINKDYLTISNGLDKKKRETNLKNSSSQRKLYIDESTYKNLQTQKIWQSSNKLLFGKLYIINNLVFTNENGTPISPDTYGKEFKKLITCSKLDIPIISLYGARHTFASNAIAYGLEPSVVANIMGHSTITTTYDNYVHVQSDPIKEATTTMHNLFYRRI